MNRGSDLSQPFDTYAAHRSTPTAELEQLTAVEGDGAPARLVARR